MARINQAHLAWHAGQVQKVLDLLVETSPAKTGGDDFRGFEWYYLQRLCEGGQVILPRKEQRIVAFACNPDGRLVVGVSAPGPFEDDEKEKKQAPVLKIWDTATGKELHDFAGYRPDAQAGSEGFGSLAFCPADKHVALWGDRSVHVWDARSGKLLHTIPQKVKGFPALGNGLAFSKDGLALAILQGKAVRLWNVQAAKEVTTPFEPHAAQLNCVSISPDGNRLIAGAKKAGSVLTSPTVLVWEIKTGKKVVTLNHPGDVFAIAVSPDGKTIASFGGDATLRLSDVRDKKEIWTVPTTAVGSITSLVFSHDSRWLLGGSMDGTIRVWETKNGTVLRTLRGHTFSVTGLALPSDGRRLISAGLDGSIRIWEWEQEQEAVTLEELRGPVMSLAFHPDGRHLASGSFGVSLWDIEKRRAVRGYGATAASAVEFSSDGKRLAVSTAGVEIWDTASGKLLGVQNWDQKDFGFPSELAFSPDGNNIAWGSKIRHAATGRSICSIAGKIENHEGPLRGGSITYSSDGKYVATAAGTQNLVSLVDATTGKLLQAFPKFPDRVLKVSFSPDGRHLVATSTSTAKVWDLNSGQEEISFRLTSTSTPIYRGFVLPGRASFSKDRRRLAIVSETGDRIQIWDMTTGQQVLSLPAPGSMVFAVAFSPDGHWLAAGCTEGVAAFGEIEDIPPKGVFRIWDDGQYRRNEHPRIQFGEEKVPTKGAKGTKRTFNWFTTEFENDGQQWDNVRVSECATLWQGRSRQQTVICKVWPPSVNGCYTDSGG